MSVEVDHYIPKEFDPELISTYSNLIISCAKCNSRTCKSDYHPKHSRRQSYRNLRKHSIYNVYKNDLSKILYIDHTGEVHSLPGLTKLARERALLNKAVFKWHMRDNPKKQYVKNFSMIKRKKEIEKEAKKLDPI